MTQYPHVNAPRNFDAFDDSEGVAPYAAASSAVNSPYVKGFQRTISVSLCSVGMFVGINFFLPSFVESAVHTLCGIFVLGSCGYMNIIPFAEKWKRLIIQLCQLSVMIAIFAGFANPAILKLCAVITFLSLFALNVVASPGGSIRASILKYTLSASAVVLLYEFSSIAKDWT